MRSDCGARTGYTIDCMVIYAGYMLIVVPIWLILANIKFILKHNWIKTIFFCVFFILIIPAFAAFAFELGALVKNTGEVTLEGFIEYFEILFAIALPNYIIMTAIIIITKASYNIYQKKKRKKNDI